MKIDIYKYKKIQDILNEAFYLKKYRNKSYSIRSWANQIGIKNHSILHKLMTGERKLTPTNFDKIANSIQLNEEERRYFEYLMLFENSKTLKDKKFYQKIIDSTANRSTIEKDLFAVLSDWYHLTIYEMINLKSFTSNCMTIKNLLHKKVSTVQVQNSLDLLKRLDLIKIDNHEIQKTQQNNLFIDYEMPNEAIKKYHQQMIEMAIEHLTNTPHHERDIRGSTVTIRVEDIEKIKLIIKDFHNQILSFSLGEKIGDHTIQVNTQLFLLS